MRGGQKIYRIHAGRRRERERERESSAFSADFEWGRRRLKLRPQRRGTARRLTGDWGVWETNQVLL